MTFIQRFDSALRLNVHAHTLVLDGVYVRNACSGELQFESLSAPSVEEVGDVARRTAERVEGLLKRRGRFCEVEHAADEALDQLSVDQLVLASCYQAAASRRELPGPRAGQPTLQRVGHGQAAARTDSPRLCGEVHAVNVHAGAAIDGRDRKRLARLCRYIARPAISQEFRGWHSTGFFPASNASSALAALQKWKRRIDTFISRPMPAMIVNTLEPP